MESKVVLTAMKLGDFGLMLITRVFGTGHVVKISSAINHSRRKMTCKVHLSTPTFFMKVQASPTQSDSGNL